MDNCIFCKIVSKDIPAKIVVETDLFVAFRDNNPQAPVHILVIPKKHFGSVNEMSAEDGAVIGGIFLAVKDIAKKEGLGKSGYRVVVNCGRDAGQAVDHMHVHLLGGRKFGWPPG